MVQSLNILNCWIKKDELVNDFDFMCGMHEAINDNSFEPTMVKKELFIHEV